MMPWMDTRPFDGLNPTTPQYAAGRDTEPMVWVPVLKSGPSLQRITPRKSTVDFGSALECLGSYPSLKITT